MRLPAGIVKFSLVLSFFLGSIVYAHAQTDADAIMMEKNNFCVGGMYGNSSWKNYWEGTPEKLINVLWRHSFSSLLCSKH